MESTQELQHWGIKGQRWGVRRYQNPDGTLTEAGKKRYYYQNPDGSLTEAGKKDYMKAAKKGKLDVSKLSDNDLNMINSRFAREKTFKQNVKEYEDSRFSTKLKNAVIERVKGIKGGKGKGKGGGLGKILALPIKKAFEEAFKDQKFEDKDDDGNKSPEEKEAIKLTSNGYRFMQSGYHEDKKERAAREANGRRFMDSAFNNRESRTAEDVLRGRNKHDRTRTTATESKSGPRNLRGLPSGGIYMDPSEYTIHSAFIVKRSDELQHWGIKGQKWGVRRFENLDGTLTPEGKERYSKSDDKHPDLDYRNSEAVGEYVFNLHQKYHDAARNDAVWRKHGLGQDTVGRFVEQKKYGDMVNHIDSVVKESREAAIKASDAARKSRENARKPGPLWENMNRKNVEYWDKFQETADEYIKNNFSNADQEVARGVIYWWYIDW